MYEALLVIFLIVAIALVALIMLQQGKGADMGASFGAGASGTLFGSSGSANFMTRTTAILATLFFIISGAWQYQQQQDQQRKRVGKPERASETEQTQPAAPAKPTSDIPQ